ncbi:MAG TPA: hypothetical protein VHT26_08600 [Trebonia sp.]|nr:hypothetical protein [Trebonia sp.]
MAKLVLTMTMSLDGFFSGPGGELDWMTQAPDPEFSRDNVSFFDRFDRGFIGYPTASGMLPFWLNVASDPQAPADQRALAQAVNRLRPFLISHREEPVPWPNAELLVVHDDVVAGAGAVDFTPSVPGRVGACRTGGRRGRVGWRARTGLGRAPSPERRAAC